VEQTVLDAAIAVMELYDSGALPHHPAIKDLANAVRRAQKTSQAPEPGATYTMRIKDKDASYDAFMAWCAETDQDPTEADIPDVVARHVDDAYLTVEFNITAGTVRVVPLAELNDPNAG
jgi:hypothetical protein